MLQHHIKAHITANDQGTHQGIAIEERRNVITIRH